MKIEDFLNDAMDIGCQYSVQYIDYSDRKWTMPVNLNQKRIQQIVTDNSIKKVKLYIDLK
jgi:hypothetical protein